MAGTPDGILGRTRTREVRGVLHSRRRSNKALELAAQDLLMIALLVAWEPSPLLIGILAVRLLRQRYLSLENIAEWMPASAPSRSGVIRRNQKHEETRKLMVVIAAVPELRTMGCNRQRRRPAFCPFALRSQS